jgi:hypothetical protein
MIRTRVYISRNNLELFLYVNEAGIYSWETDDKYFNTIDLAINNMRLRGNQIWCKLFKV